MMNRVVVLALLAAVGLPSVACDDDDAATFPTGPITGNVLLDARGSIEPVLGVEDTFHVTIPAGRVLGTIIESSEPIIVRWGPGRFDVINSGFGGAFAAIVPRAGTGSQQLRVRRTTLEGGNADYRLRVIAVNDAPEHAPEDIPPDGRFRGEWIDPPLDRDLFAIDFEEGEHFYLELEPSDADTRITAFIVQPDGLIYYVFLAAGPERARSGVFETIDPGDHQLVVYSTGLQADVEAPYRFRVVKAD